VPGKGFLFPSEKRDANVILFWKRKMLNKSILFQHIKSPLALQQEGFAKKEYP